MLSLHSWIPSLTPFLPELSLHVLLQDLRASLKCSLVLPLTGISGRLLEEGLPHCPIVGTTLSQDPKCMASLRSGSIPSLSLPFQQQSKASEQGKAAIPH